MMIIKNMELEEEQIDTFPEREAQEDDMPRGIRQETLSESIHIIHRDAGHTGEVFFEAKAHCPLLKMRFEIEGYSNYLKANGDSLNGELFTGCYQLSFFPELAGSLRCADCQRYTIEILVALDYLKKLLHNDLTALSHFGKQVENNTPVTFFPSCLPLTPTIRRGLTDLICCSLTGVCRKIYLKAKVIELLMLQTELYNTPVCLKHKPCVNSQDIEKLYYVKNLLAREPNHTYSLHEISKLAGLNDFKLKKGFKELFHQTVFGYLTEVRMEKARTMILENNYSIADVAYSIGYKNPQHFTACFKRKFGYLPSSLRKAD